MGPGRSAISRRTVLAGMLASAAIRSASARVPETGVPVLAYHRFDPVQAGPTTLTVKTFEAQLAWLDGHGYRVAPLTEGIAATRTAAPGRIACITVDDGHRSVYAYLFPLIRKHRLPVTLFVYPSAISNASYALTWDQLREMRATGLVDVQSHTYWHPDFSAERRRRKPADYAAFVDDQLLRSKRVLETRLGGHVDLLAWPYGLFDAELEQAARRAGYRAAFAYSGGPMLAGDDMFALPRVPIGEADRADGFGARLQRRTPMTGRL